MILTYEDWTTVTTRQLALKVLAEGRLITEILIDGRGERCVMGVINNSRRNPPRRLWLTQESNARLGAKGRKEENDAFVGTPEGRCVHMAGILRDLPLDPEELVEADVAVETEMAVV